jgi:hypothetical protein
MPDEVAKSLHTPRWSGMDSNVQFRPIVKVRSPRPDRVFFIGFKRRAAMEGADTRPQRYSAHAKPQDADPDCSRISRGFRTGRRPASKRRGRCNSQGAANRVVPGLQSPGRARSRRTSAAIWRRDQRSRLADAAALQDAVGAHTGLPGVPIFGGNRPLDLDVGLVEDDERCSGPSEQNSSPIAGSRPCSMGASRLKQVPISCAMRPKNPR